MRSRLNRIQFWVILVLGGILYLGFQFGVSLYTDYLWFDHLDLTSVFMTGLWASIWVGLMVALPFAAIFWTNTLIARWLSVRNVLFFSEDTLVAQKWVLWSIGGVGGLLAWLVGTAASSNWLMFLRFFNREPFGLVDPIFGQDVTFYVFTLPLLHFIQTWLIIGLFLSIFGTVAVYALAQQNNLVENRVVILPHVQLHLSILGMLIFFVFAIGHWIDLFNLMYSSRGVAFGASYTDINVSIPALWTLIVVAILAGIALPITTLFRQPVFGLFGIFAWVFIGVVGNGIIPGVVQRYIVEPNELVRERPYIEHNIEFTNIAYGLDRVVERDFSQIVPLTAQDLTNNETVLKNLRLWDYRPLQQTYQQIQAIRLYYNFSGIDFDRYMIDGELRQVALSARELDKSQLQSRTWVNEKLQFTHGYGVVVNPVNEVTNEGLPSLWVQDLPPQSNVGLDVARPEIYYGEGTQDYVFVKTTENEFSYPSGDENVFTSYEGTGGVLMDSALKRLAFALRLSDINIMLSPALTNESRVLLYRNIGERVRQVAPFLTYDADPYIVIADDGNLYWIQDAYTTSDRFPYAEPYNRINYIRNSVKVVIDAYDGTMTFYVTDDEDPLLKSYRDIFPELFTPMEEMPAWLQRHIRYPVDMFRVQSTMYRTYHMRNVNVFYNKEDLWQVPLETVFGNSGQPVEPYYVVLKLTGAEESEFALIQPFTPNNKDNLIGWLAARSDGEQYGELVVYRFPKQQLVFGPRQIEARIDQNPEISAQITLWDQGGSEVIRGNLLVLPIDDALLYVEPLYLRAENGEIPELRRVILASGERVVMRETLAEAAEALFSGAVPAVIPDPELDDAPPPTTVADEEIDDSSVASSETQPVGPVLAPGPVVSAPPADADVSTLAQRASEHYEAAQVALQDGDWATYGAELNQMAVALEELVALTNGEPAATE